MTYQVKDPYFNKAKQENYPARSVYKLEEIDRKYHLLAPGDRVLDLGSAPGSWLKYAAEKVGKRGLAMGIDLKPLNILLPLWAYFVQVDIFSLRPEDFQQYASLSPAVENRFPAGAGVRGNFEAVLSDMAPATTGVRLADEQNSLSLARQALQVAQEILAPGGKFLVKIFEGEDLPDFVNEVKPLFEKVHLIRPQATRKGSREVFVLGLKKG